MKMTWQAGVAAVRRRKGAAHVAEWRSSDYCALPGLWGSGFGGTFMRAVHASLAAQGFTECRVELVSHTAEPHTAEPHTDAGTRREITDQLGFYRGHGYTLAPATRAGQAVLTRALV